MVMSDDATLITTYALECRRVGEVYATDQCRAFGHGRFREAAPTLRGSFSARYKKTRYKRAFVFGGRGGIRTLGTDKRTHTFQACSIGHSDTLPEEAGV